MKKWVTLAALLGIGVDVFALVLLILLGIVIILVIKTFLFLLPAAVVAFAIWYITGDNYLTGIAFLIIAAISLIKKK